MNSSDYISLPLNADDLLSFLFYIHSATGITVLRLADPYGDRLPQSLLDDMGVVPRSLTRMSWDVQSQLVTYRLESHGGRTVAVEIESQYSTMHSFQCSIGVDEQGWLQ